MLFHRHWLLLLSVTLFIPATSATGDDDNRTAILPFPDNILNVNVTDVAQPPSIAIGIPPKPIQAVQGKQAGAAVNKPVEDLMSAGSATSVGKDTTTLGKTGTPLGYEHLDAGRVKTEKKIRKVEGKPIPMTRQKFPAAQLGSDIQSHPAAATSDGYPIYYGEEPSAVDARVTQPVKVITAIPTNVLVNPSPSNSNQGIPQIKPKPLAETSRVNSAGGGPSNVDAHLAPVDITTTPAPSSSSVGSPSGNSSRKIPIILGKPVPLTRDDLPSNQSDSSVPGSNSADPSSEGKTVKNAEGNTTDISPAEKANMSKNADEGNINGQVRAAIRKPSPLLPQEMQSVQRQQLLSIRPSPVSAMAKLIGQPITNGKL